VDPVVRQVDRRWRADFGLGGRELSESPMWSRLVFPVCQIGGQGSAQVLFVEDQYSVEQFAAKLSDDPFADRSIVGLAAGSSGSGFPRRRTPRRTGR
jgi:hypothetical protein